MTPRNYQIVCLNKLWSALQTDLNILLDACCSAGKTFIFSKLIQKLIQKNSNFRVLILLDREILVKQTRKKLIEVAPELTDYIGIACNSVLKKKDINNQVVIASRQTLINMIDDLKPFQLCIVDECHFMRLPKDNDTEESQDQFGKIISFLRISNDKMRLFGCTASPYRTVDGYIYGDRNIEGSVPYFDKVTHKITVQELEKQNFLAPLKGLSIIPDKFNESLANIGMIAGDYNQGQLFDFMSNTINIESCYNSYIEHAKDRKKVLMFCVNIEHAEIIKEFFRSKDIENCFAIHSKLDDFENSQAFTALYGIGGVFTSVAKLTTGMDVIDIDGIIQARPTQSVSLYKQMLGRGQRLYLEKYPNKKDCLVIDLVGNGDRFGRDLDNLYVKYQKRLNKNGSPIYKDCPKCFQECFRSQRICSKCGYEFPVTEKQENKNISLESVGYGKLSPVKMPVTAMYINKHKSKKTGNYLIRLRFELQESLFKTITANKWMCLPDYYEGYAIQNAKKLWNEIAFTGYEFPVSCDYLMENLNSICKPESAMIDISSKYPEIKEFIFEEIPF